MFSIDKRAFGSFVAQLRRERGLTQRELAERLFISDKAVSKWETGSSIPDTALLIPLAEELGVSVTELLMCQRVQQPMDPGTVEGLVQTAIHYADERPARAWQQRSVWMLLYPLCLALGCGCLLWQRGHGGISEAMWISLLLGAAFGVYFVFLARTKLPRYYDENRISAVSDGPLRLNLPGATFHNGNWPRILQIGRVWSCLSMSVLPALSALLGHLAPALWERAETAVCLILLLGGLFIPMYRAGRQ